MSASSIQTWVAIIGALLTALVGLLQYFRYRSRRDRMAEVGAAFTATVESLASDNEIERMAAAVLLRRFFDRSTEQGAGKAPYKRETVEVIAGLLRQATPGLFQKVLADGLRYAQNLDSVDLQGCNLQDAYLGRKQGDKRGLDLSNADLWRADCARASFRDVKAKHTVFSEAGLEDAVFIGAELQMANFRRARLSNAQFSGAKIEGACFMGADGVPKEVSELLDDDFVGLPRAEVGRGVSV